MRIWKAACYNGFLHYKISVSPYCFEAFLCHAMFGGAFMNDRSNTARDSNSQRQQREKAHKSPVAPSRDQRRGESKPPFGELEKKVIEHELKRK